MKMLIFSLLFISFACSHFNENSFISANSTKVRTLASKSKVPCDDQFRSMVNSRRAKTLTEEAIGEKFSITIKRNGEDVAFEGIAIPEVERRVDLPGFPLSIQNKAGTTTTIGSQDELLVDLLDYFSRPERYRPDGNQFMLNALASKTSRFHKYDPSKKIITSEGKKEVEDKYLTMDLKGNRYRWLDNQGYNLEKYSPPYRIETMLENNDFYERSYIVGRQFERSTYYDIPSKLPVALRVKNWFGISPEDGQPLDTPFKKMLFIKTLPDDTAPDSLSTARYEYQLPIPLDLLPEELDALMRALLKEVQDINVHPDEVINPAVEIENTRYGIDIVRTGQNGKKRPAPHSKPKKVGFMTIDYYHRHEIGSGSDAPVLQFEYELLPKYQDLFEKEKEDFESFFYFIESRYNAFVNPTPKYIKN